MGRRPQRNLKVKEYIGIFFSFGFEYCACVNKSGWGGRQLKILPEIFLGKHLPDYCLNSFCLFMHRTAVTKKLKHASISLRAVFKPYPPPSLPVAFGTTTPFFFHTQIILCRDENDASSL